MMQAIKGGISRRKRQRQSLWWALAIAVLALVWPTTAIGARGQVRPQLAATGVNEATTGAHDGPVSGPRHGRDLLVLGSGYGSPNGSPLVRDLQRRLALEGYPAGRVDGIRPRVRGAHDPGPLVAGREEQGAPRSPTQNPHGRLYSYRDCPVT